LQKKILKKVHVSFIAAIVWFIIATILLTIPGTDLPQEDWLDKIPLFDKWIHIGMFAILVTLWCRSRLLLKTKTDSQKLKQVFITIGVIWLGYGVAMEFVQKYFIPFRSFDISDIIADGVGCAAGVFFSIRRYIKK
jgi:VanZ like family